jgi:hypothetical protein
MIKMIKKIMMILALIAALGATIPLSIKASRLIAGTPALAARVSIVETRLNNHVDQERLDDLEARMWAMEERWGEKFIIQYNRIHDSMKELLLFMTPEASDHYRYLEKQYNKLLKQMEEDED